MERLTSGPLASHVKIKLYFIVHDSINLALLELYFFGIYKFIVSSVLAKLFGDKFGKGTGKNGDSLNGGNGTDSATGRCLILIFKIQKKTLLSNYYFPTKF